MSAFKVGDKVRLIQQGQYGDTWDGDMIVTDVYSSGNVGTDRGGAFSAEQLELVVEKPKRDYVADHARRTLRKAGLTKEQAAQYVRNMQNGEPDVPLSSISRKLPGTLYGFLGCGFLWSTSPEGFDYWSAIQNTHAPKEQNA